MEREIRRYQDHLANIGTGIMLFGAWSAIKFNMEFYFRAKELLETLQENEKTAGILIVFTICGLASIFILLWNLYIGICARSEGMKPKNRWLYLVLSAFAIVAYFSELLSEILGFSNHFDDIGTGLVTIFIDFTMLVTLIEMEHAAIKTRKLKRKLAEQG